MNKTLLKLALGIATVTAGMSSFAQTYTFTNAGATGRLGPTQVQVNAAYTGGNTLAGDVTINTQGIQEWTVPSSGLYRIEGYGANGYGQGGYIGGQGAYVSGEFNLTAGAVIKVVVAQQGLTGQGSGGGGGGGSFVYSGVIGTGTLYIAAGGGGGGGHNTGTGGGGSATTTPVDGGGTRGNGGFQGLGLGGNGGLLSGGSSSTWNSAAAGGAGWGSNGLAGYFAGNAQYQSFPGTRFEGGYHGNTGTGNGGFGGGGGSGGNGTSGGGGGGYTGGGGGDAWNGSDHGGGQGAGSFNGGANQTNTAATNLGMGSVIITSLCNPSVAPTIIAACPSDTIINNDTTTCGAVVNYTAPFGSDNCGNLVATQNSGLASGSIFPVGVTTNSFTINNGIGVPYTCSFTVTVVDADLPTVVCPNDTVLNNDPGVCGAVVNFNTPAGSDNCSGVTVALTSSLPSGSVFPVGVSTVTFEATDAASNVSIPCSFTVTVNNTLQTNILMNPYNSDTICHGNNTVPVPAASPAGGTYSGPGITGSTFTPGAAGPGVHYTLYSIVDANTCTNSDSAMIVVEHCTGIEVTDELSNISIYPNPTNGIVNINLGDNNNAINYSITTIEGRVVMQETNVTDNNLTVNLSNESKGIYLLKIEDNSSAKVFKIVRR